MTPDNLRRRPVPPVYLVLAALALVGLAFMLLLGGRKTAAPAAAEPLPTSAQDISELQVYPNFAEVKAPVQIAGGTYTLHGETDPYLLTDTANLEGVNVLSRTLTGGEGWLTSLEGQAMTLYVNGKPMPVTLIRARDLLIRDWNGKYRRVNAAQLAFDRPPPINGQSNSQTLSFQADKSGAATLTYLTRGFSWTPHYNLNLQGNEAVLTALADIRNPSDQTYAVKGTELISGDVNIYGAEAQSVRDMGVATSAPSSPTSGAVMNAARPLGELRGLHRFKLDQPFTLKARSTTSLPFLTPKITPERLNTINTYFSTGAGSGIASRSYRLKADAYLPAGNVLIRDEGRVVGQASLPNTAAQMPITLSMGDDPELTYTRTVKVLQRDATGAAFQVTINLKNSKDKAARVRVTENLGSLSGRVIKLTGDAVQEGLTATFAAELPAQGSLTRSFKVDARIRTSPNP